MAEKKNPRGDGGESRDDRSKAPKTQYRPSRYAEQHLEDARELWHVMRDPRLVLGYEADELLAVRRREKLGIWWDRELLAVAAEDLFSGGYERFRRRDLTQEELLELAQWFSDWGASLDAHRREMERLHRVQAHYCGVAV